MCFDPVSEALSGSMSAPSNCFLQFEFSNNRGDACVFNSSDCSFNMYNQFHFKISSRIYSLRRTFLYSFRPTLALF